MSANNSAAWLSIILATCGVLAPLEPRTCFAAAAQNARLIERLYVFGDSYSDGGNGYALTRRPQSPPYDARYSDGMTAAEYMAKAFGLSLHYSEDDNAPADSSFNFAVSGAWTSRKNNEAAIDGTTGLLGQVASLEQRLNAGKARFDGETTLFFIAIGTNDVLFGNISGLDRRVLVAQALENVDTAVRSLHARGARHIAVATIPSVNLTPRGASLPPAKAKAVGEGVLALNDGYRRLAVKLRSELKADVFAFPWGRYYDELVSDPSVFGIANVGRCLRSTPGGTAVCPDPQRFVFWDGIHPTTAAHRVVGYRLAMEGRPHIVCPDSLKLGATMERPACRFASASDGTTPSDQADPDQRAAGTCMRVAFRQTGDMCNNCTAPPWNGQVSRTSGDEWILTYVDGRNRSGNARWRVTTENNSEIVFHDITRDLYTRFDLAARKGFQRRGSNGPWMLMADVLYTVCR